MKSKLYIFSLALIFLALGSCRKWLPENRIVGTWRLVDVEKRRLLNSEELTTDYESGTFVFNNNGTAAFSDSAVQLDGTWSMRRERDGYYDDDGDWNSDGRTILVVRLYNFSANKVLDWYFDRIDFRSSGDKLIAFMDGASYTYRYDFRKQ